MNKTILTLILVGLAAMPRANATSFILADFVYTVNSSANTAVHTSSLGEIQFGYFASGFAPTLANFNQWQTNFTGVSGYYDGATPEWSAGIDIGTNAQYPINTQLVAIVYDLADDGNLLTATQAAIVTNTAWIVTASSGSDPTHNYYDFTGNYGPAPIVTATTTALFGSINHGSSVVTMSAVPEPSTGALMMRGAAGLVALRRLRKV